MSLNLTRSGFLHSRRISRKTLEWEVENYYCGIAACVQNLNSAAKASVRSRVAIDLLTSSRRSFVDRPTTLSDS